MCYITNLPLNTIALKISGDFGTWNIQKLIIISWRDCFQRWCQGPRRAVKPTTLTNWVDKGRKWLQSPRGNIFINRKLYPKGTKAFGRVEQISQITLHSSSCSSSDHISQVQWRDIERVTYLIESLQNSLLCQRAVCRMAASRSGNAKENIRRSPPFFILSVYYSLLYSTMIGLHGLLWTQTPFHLKPKMLPTCIALYMWRKSM